MINKKDWARIEAELNAVQKGCCARTYTIEEIYEIAEEVEKEVVKFSRWMYKFLTYEESIGVAMSYKASAVSTYITISFNASGK